MICHEGYQISVKKAFPKVHTTATKAKNITLKIVKPKQFFIQKFTILKKKKKKSKEPIGSDLA
ncbi:MAG: hypothetical protein NZ805_05935 [Armatimonadetes bacterium]|nr:hypothetical protein [Armatimonadota bacterium]MDW8029585.1 hypothetical protein [Armatimonadota bacterium]